MLYCTAFYYQYRILRKEQLNFDEEKSGVVYITVSILCLACGLMFSDIISTVRVHTKAKMHKMTSTLVPLRRTTRLQGTNTNCGINTIASNLEAPLAIKTSIVFEDRIKPDLLCRLAHYEQQL
jgi:hypothetical protein